MHIYIYIYDIIMHNYIAREAHYGVTMNNHIVICIYIDFHRNDHSFNCSCCNESYKMFNSPSIQTQGQGPVENTFHFEVVP